MKLVYLTSHRYPSFKVEPFFIQSMAEAFAEILGPNFFFLVRGKVPDNLKHLGIVPVRSPRRLRIVFYFFFLPILIAKHKWLGRTTVFFSSDPYLLSILIFWRRMFRFKYRVCSDWHQLFGDWRDQYVARHSDYLISTSERLGKLLSFACGIDSDRIIVAYGGVNISIFEKHSKYSQAEHRRKLALPTNALLVGYIGGFKSLGIEKGIVLMIKALLHLNNKIIMVFVGGSKLEISEYVLLAKKENVENRCIFVKKQPLENVVKYEMAMDILVIPYPNKPHFRDHGFPMKVWEYMASGRPIVFSNLEIIREVLRGRATSFRAGDSQSLAKVISSVLKNRNSVEETAKQNPYNVRAYTWKARANKIVNFIQEKIMRDE